MQRCRRTQRCLLGCSGGRSGYQTRVGNDWGGSILPLSPSMRTRSSERPWPPLSRSPDTQSGADASACLYHHAPQTSEHLIVSRAGNSLQKHGGLSQEPNLSLTPRKLEEKKHVYISLQGSSGLIWIRLQVTYILLYSWQVNETAEESWRKKKRLYLCPGDVSGGGGGARLWDDGSLTAVLLGFLCSLLAGWWQHPPKQARKTTPPPFSAASALHSSDTVFLTLVVRERDKVLRVLWLKAEREIEIVQD